MMLYERKRDKQVYYVLPITSIHGKLPVVPVGDTGTAPLYMRQHEDDFVDVAFDRGSEGAGDGSRWWVINTCALHWARAK